MNSLRLLSALLLLAGLCAPAAAADPEADGDWAVVLGRQLDILNRQPDNREARKAAWRAAMRLGLFEQAAALVAPLSIEEQRAMEGDRIALEIRYGIIDRNTLHGPPRFWRLDQALTATDALAAGFYDGKQPDAEDRRRLTDRLSALAARRRAADAVRLYETLQERGVTVPLWAKRDVAGSYLELRRPRPAVTLYREVVTANPDDFDANLGLFYALVEAEEIAAATAHIDQFAARQPERRHRDGKYNSERLSADVSADQVRIYGDRLAEAQERITARQASIPFNGEVRQAGASLALARGWPNRGEQTLRRAIGTDPANPALHADLAETRLTLQDWPAARASLNDALDLDSGNSGVRRARETFRLHDSYELYIDAGFGVGQNNSYLGSSNFAIDSFLYSRPLAENWRIFAHNYTTRADLDGATETWVRSGVGAEWRWLDWRLTGEVNGGSDIKAGVTGTARWKPDDQWTVFATAESVTNHIPLRAVADGINAKRGEMGVDWRAHESRKLAVIAMASDFSDGNQRTSVIATWFERWLSGPRWIFQTTLGADTTHNTLDSSVNYFNPKNDHSLWLNATVETLTWRNYDWSFHQRLALTGGNYWQEYYPSGAIKAIEYGHRWELDRNASLRYSFSRLLRPYDGVREARNEANLTLTWRF